MFARLPLPPGTPQLHLTRCSCSGIVVPCGGGTAATTPFGPSWTYSSGVRLLVASMGKAIAFFAILALCGFAFVIGHLALRRPTPGQVRATEAGPVLVNQEDGSVYSIGLKIDGFERRLMEEETRSQALEGELTTLRTERDELKTQVSDLVAEVRRLRKQVNEKPKVVAPPPDASTPPTAASGPVSAPVVPQPDAPP